MDKFLTVVIVARNNLELTKVALESLSKNTDANVYKLIFMDSGSTDETNVWVVNFCKEKRIELKYQYFSENKGCLKCYNQGIKIADTEYILTCHNDIVFPHQWLHNMMRRFTDDNVAAVGPVVTFCMGMQRPDLAFQTFGAEVKFLLGLFFLCRKSVYERIKYKDGEYLSEAYGLGDKEELELCYRIRKLGYKFEIARDVIVEHTGEKSFIDSLGSQEAFYKYQKKQEGIIRHRLGNEIVDELFQINNPNPVKLLIGIPTRTSYVHSYFMFSMLRMYGSTPVYREVFHIPRGMISDSRNKIVERLLEGDFTHLLFVDDDHVFSHDSVIKLLSHDLDIVTGTAFQRGEPHLPCIYRESPDGEFYNPIETTSDMGIGEIDGCGAFFILIKRRVFETIPKPWFKYADQDLKMGGGGGIGEDLYFCKKAKNNGFKIWADTLVETKHIGCEQLIDREFFEKYRKENPLTDEKLKPKEFMI